MGDRTKENKVYQGGTLVVCALSLVTQWIEEAETRAGGTLSIHSYHGSHRKRDPKELSSYDIVVTTYTTLGSDMFRQAYRKQLHYVPPLNGVKWHRVILDESHCMKDLNTQQAKAALALNADRRWCVSGTPVVMQLDDILNQLKFVGLPPLTTDPSTWKAFTYSKVRTAVFFLYY